MKHLVLTLCSTPTPQCNAFGIAKCQMQIIMHPCAHARRHPPQVGHAGGNGSALLERILRDAQAPRTPLKHRPRQPGLPVLRVQTQAQTLKHRAAISSAQTPRCDFMHSNTAHASQVFQSCGRRRGLRRSNTAHTSLDSQPCGRSTSTSTSTPNRSIQRRARGGKQGVVKGGCRCQLMWLRVCTEHACGACV